MRNSFKWQTLYAFILYNAIFAPYGSSSVIENVNGNSYQFFPVFVNTVVQGIDNKDLPSRSLALCRLKCTSPFQCLEEPRYITGTWYNNISSDVKDYLKIESPVIVRNENTSKDKLLNNLFDKATLREHLGSPTLVCKGDHKQLIVLPSQKFKNGEYRAFPSDREAKFKNGWMPAVRKTLEGTEGGYVSLASLKFHIVATGKNVIPQPFSEGRAIFEITELDGSYERWILDSDLHTVRKIPLDTKVTLALRHLTKMLFPDPSFGSEEAKMWNVASDYDYFKGGALVGHKYQIGSFSIDRNGVEKTLPVNPLHNVSFNEGLIPTSYRTYIDTQGNTQVKIDLPSPIVILGNFSDGLAAIGVQGDGVEKIGYVDRYGNWKIPLRPLSEASDFHEGLAVVRKIASSGYEIIDTSGNIITTLPENIALDPLLSNFYPRMSFSSNSSSHSTPGSSNRFQGGGVSHSTLIPLSDNKTYFTYNVQDEFDIRFSNGLMRHFSKEGRFLGFIDKNGKLVIEASKDWSMVRNFRENRAVVRVSEYPNLDVYGQIDLQGREIIPSIYDGLGEMSEGATVAMKFENGNRKYQVIDINGKTRNIIWK